MMDSSPEFMTDICDECNSNVITSVSLSVASVRFCCIVMLLDVFLVEEQEHISSASAHTVRGILISSQQT